MSEEYNEYIIFTVTDKDGNEILDGQNVVVKIQGIPSDSHHPVGIDLSMQRQWEQHDSHSQKTGCKSSGHIISLELSPCSRR